jgi:hypothetical protein
MEETVDVIAGLDGSTLMKTSLGLAFTRKARHMTSEMERRECM